MNITHIKKIEKLLKQDNDSITSIEVIEKNFYEVKTLNGKIYDIDLENGYAEITGETIIIKK
jgi:hypothetical protein